MIGKLQAYRHKETKEIDIPEEYRSRCKATDDNTWDGHSRPKSFSKEDQELLQELITDIIGEDPFNDGSSKLDDLLNVKKQVTNMFDLHDFLFLEYGW